MVDDRLSRVDLPLWTDRRMNPEWAGSSTSFATADTFPASPARAASILALSAGR
jgi:hypothetical protein